MKTFLKKLFILSAIFLSIASVASLTSPTPTYAADGSFNCRYFLGMTSWDCGIQEFRGEDNLVNNAVIIASNVFADISVIAAYLVLGYVIYGGYLYIFSSGDPGKVQNGKKTLIRAFIGLAIVMLSNVILNAIRIALLGNRPLGDCINTQCMSPDQLVTNAIQWFIGIAGVVAAIFVVIGGISYVTSSGEPSKIQKAKTTIIYALIGLAIVGIAEIITAFISNMIRNAETNAISNINNTIIIAKEINHEN